MRVPVREQEAHGYLESFRKQLEVGAIRFFSGRGIGSVLLTLCRPSNVWIQSGESFVASPATMQVLRERAIPLQAWGFRSTRVTCFLRTEEG